LHGRNLKLEIALKSDKSSRKKDTKSSGKNVDDQVVINDNNINENIQSITKDIIDKDLKTKADSKNNSKITNKKVVAPKESDNKELQVDTTDDNKGDQTEVGIKKSRQLLVFGIPVDINKKCFKMFLSKISKKEAQLELIKEVNKINISNNNLLTLLIIIIIIYYYYLLLLILLLLLLLYKRIMN
jgi:hypothetical protein